MFYSIQTGVRRTATKTQKFIIAAAALAFASALALSSGGAEAFTGAYSLFGDASYVSPGAGGSGRAVEADGTAVGSGIIFPAPAGTTFGDIDELSTDYFFTSGTCMAGSPRFQVRVVDPVLGTRNIFVYIGPPPAYTPCPTPTYVNTGDLLEGVNPIDTSQLTGGTFYDPYTVALAKYENYEVLRVSLVVDPGYSQVVRFDNTVVDEYLYTYDEPTSKDECKNGGWMNLTDDEGNSFKNQGDCVSYVASGGKNKGNG